MPRKEVPPIEPGKMDKGGWNPGPRGPRPDLTPAPFGTPFASEAPRTASPAPGAAERLNGKTERTEVPPIQPHKIMGNWNFGPRGPRPDIVPAPFGIPFARPRLPAPPPFPTDE